MRYDRRHPVLDESDENFEGELREDLATLRRAANAAGYSTAEPAVQAALLRLYGSLQAGDAAVSGITVLERICDHLRAARRSWQS